MKHSENVNIRNRRGWTRLHDAAARNSVDAIKALVALGADIDAKNKKGWTPLYRGNFDDIFCCRSA